MTSIILQFLALDIYYSVVNYTRYLGNEKTTLSLKRDLFKQLDIQHTKTKNNAHTYNSCYIFFSAF